MKQLVVILFILLTCGVANAQSIEQLQKSMEKAQKAIDNGNRLLKINKSKTSSALDKIIITNNNLRNRQKIINSLNGQVRLIRKSINNNNSEISKLSNELGKEKEMYAKMMVSAYKRYLSNANLLFLFSATSFQDLHLRIYYLHKYSEMKRDLAKSIEKKSSKIFDQTQILAEKQAQLEKKNKDVAKEVAKLSSEKKKYNQLHSSLSKEKQKLRKQVSDGIKLKKSLQRKIAQIIDEEQSKGKQKKNIDYKLSSSFESNEGKLPMPVRNGTIVEQFGTHRHPLYPSIVIENKGINIAIENNTVVNSVFNGEVARVFFIQGLNNSVMIRHGEYLTVYSGLTVVSVQKGDKITTGQAIGKISDDKNSATLHFEVYKGKTALNPENWLR